MSFQGKKGGGGGNPFARGPTPQAGVGQNNAPRGIRGGGGGGNPFATKIANTPSQVINQPNFQSNIKPNQWNAQSQKPQGGGSFGVSAKVNSNPFAKQSMNAGGFGSSSGMEMDSSNSAAIGGNHYQQPSRGGFMAQQSKGGKPQLGTTNPFASSSQHTANQSNTIFATNKANQVSSQGFNSSFSGGNQFQQQQQQQQPAPIKQNPFFNGGVVQQQNHRQHTNSFQPQSQQTQFSGGFQNRGMGMSQQPAAPVRTVVSAQALSAVNLSAALAPSQVQEIDLGLGLGGETLLSAQTTGPSSGCSGGDLFLPTQPPHPASNEKIWAATSSSGEGGVAKMIELLDSILASSPLQGLSEEAPQEAAAGAGPADVYQLLQGGALVAGRVPAAPPVTIAQPQHQPKSVSGTVKMNQANPFSNSSTGGSRADKPNSIFGVKK